MIYNKKDTFSFHSAYYILALLFLLTIFPFLFLSPAKGTADSRREREREEGNIGDEIKCKGNIMLNAMLY